MQSTKPGMMQHIRLSLAIAGKDIIDALKNKTILSQFGSLLFIIVLYQYLPVLSNANEPLRLCVHDPAETQWVDTFLAEEVFRTIPASSTESMQDYVADRDMMVIGVSLPSDFDRKIAAGQAINLEGYFAHWQAQEDVDRAAAFFEENLSRITGTQINIHTQGNLVYSRPNSKGLAFSASLTIGVVAMIAGLTLVPNLMLEEKRTKTIDALMVSPAGAGHIAAGKALAGLFYTLAFVVLALFMRRMIITQWWLAILGALIGMLFSVAGGLLLGSIFDNRQQLTIWAFLVLNILIVPGIAILMEELLPATLVSVLQWFPLALLIQVLIVSFGESAALSVYGPELAVLLGMTITLLAGLAVHIRRSDR